MTAMTAVTMIGTAIRYTIQSNSDKFTELNDRIN